MWHQDLAMSIKGAGIRIQSEDWGLRFGVSGCGSGSQIFGFRRAAIGVSGPGTEFGE